MISSADMGIVRREWVGEAGRVSLSDVPTGLPHASCVVRVFVAIWWIWWRVPKVHVNENNVGKI